ncbi:MAG: EamA family transporter [Streptosporangiaceae bacterium]
MVAIVLALASAISYGGSDFAAGLASRRADVIRITLIASVAGLAVILVAFPLTASHPPGAAALTWGVVVGLGGTVGALALYLGFRHAAFSVAGPLSAVGAAGFSVLAGLLLGEHPTALALTGIVLALPAIVGVSASAARTGQVNAPRSDDATMVDQSPIRTAEVADPAAPAESAPGATAPDRSAPAVPAVPAVPAPGRPALRVAAAGRPAAGVAAGLVAGAGFALVFIGLNQAGSGSGLWPVAVAQVAEIVVICGMAAVTGNFRLPGARSGWLAAITGAAGALGTILYFFAVHDGFLAVTAVLTSLYPAITIVLARTLLGERLTALRLAGLALAAVCVALIAVGGAG